MNLFGDLFLTSIDGDIDLFDLNYINLFYLGPDEIVADDTVNEFLGLIDGTFKNLHKEMIESLLENTALTQPIRFVYTGSKFEICENCVYDPIGGKSANIFKQGGPQYFHNGQMCPMCGGQGKSVVTTSEINYMMVGWNSKSWAKMASNAVQTPEMMIQTKSKITLKPKIMKVSYIEIIDAEEYGVMRFVRHGDPEPCGFNGNYFLHTMWKRIK